MNDTSCAPMYPPPFSGETEDAINNYVFSYYAAVEEWERQQRGGGHADAEGRVYAPYRRDRTRLLESLALAIGLPQDALEWEP